MVEEVLGGQNAEDINPESVYRWAHLKTSPEQIARSRWKEEERCSDMSWTMEVVTVVLEFRIQHFKVR